MSKKVAIIISPNWRDYAKKYLFDCLESLRGQDWAGESKIFLIDNETDEESITLLNNIVEMYGMGLKEGGKKNIEMQNPPDPPLQGGRQVETHNHASVQIIRIKDNSGFARGNNEAMRLALRQGFDYLILFNMDTVIGKNCVSELVKVAESNPPSPPSTSSGQALYQGGEEETPLTPACAGRPLYKGGKIGAVQARLMLYPEKNKINSLGNITHFLGFGYCLGYREKFENCKLPSSRAQAEGKIAFVPSSGRGENSICYPSGAAVLFKAEVLKRVGLFDEEFWMYNEDQDLGWRIWLAGYKCVLAPEAVVYHKYEFAKSIKQYYFMDRNRMLAVIKNYHWLTLILIAPACLIMELGLLLFSAKTGWLKEKIKVWLYFLKPRTWQYLIKARRQAQSLRQVKDRDIVKMFTGKIWYQEIGDWKLSLVNPVFELYWRLAKKVIFW